MNKLIYSFATTCIFLIKIAIAVGPLEEDIQEISKKGVSQQTIQENDKFSEEDIFNLLVKSAKPTVYNVDDRKNLYEERDYSFKNSLGYYVKAE